MGKGNKAKNKNGFFYFMIEKQNQLKKNGQNYQISDTRLQLIAGDVWKKMTKEERAPYENEAKIENKNQHIQKKTAQIQQDNFNHQLSCETEQLSDDEEARLEYYERLIESCVKVSVVRLLMVPFKTEAPSVSCYWNIGISDGPLSIQSCKSQEDLVNASFFIMGSNVMVRTDDKPNQWLPLEIGICQYSILNGIIYTYHEFVDSGRPPMGYMRLSNEHAEMTHRIPLDNFLLASNNYTKIVEDITTILDNSRFINEITGKSTPMMIFCREDALEQNRGIFDWLANKYAQTYPGFKWHIEVLDLNYLVYNILNSLGYRLSIALIEEKLTASAFDYSDNTLCDYHEDLDNRYCARGLARALCYMMSQMLCPLFDITPTESHLPYKREGIVAEAYTGQLSEAKPFLHRYHSSQSDEEWQPQDSQQQKQSAKGRLTGIGRGRTGW